MVHRKTLKMPPKKILTNLVTSEPFSFSKYFLINQLKLIQNYLFEQLVAHKLILNFLQIGGEEKNSC